MYWDRIKDWAQSVANRYPLTVWLFNVGEYIEDNLGHYIALVPVSNAKNGHEAVTDNGRTLEVLSRYYVIFRLPYVDDGIARDCILEASRLGTVRSFTSDIRRVTELLSLFKNQTPPKDRTFIAVEVEVPITIPKTCKAPCHCLLTCVSSE